MSLKSGLLIIWLAVTFIPVSTVFADDSEDFVACQQIKPKGKFRPMKEKKNCFRDLARQRESELIEAEAEQSAELKQEREDSYARETKCMIGTCSASSRTNVESVHEYSRDYGGTRMDENTTTNTNVTDNSMQMSSNVNSNTQVDSSQNTMNINTTDNSSVFNINSSTDTYNVDNSQVINNISSNTTKKLIQSCGMTLEQAHAVVNIVKDEAAKTNTDASITSGVKGNSNTITDVRLETEVDFEGGDIDESCVLDAVNDMQNELEN